MIMEAEKSHNLLSSSRRPRKAGDVVLIQNRSPENQGSQWHKSQSESKDLRIRSNSVLVQEKINVPARAESKLTLPPPFCSIQTPKDWMMPTHIGEDDLPYSVHYFQMLNLFQKHVHRHTQK